jgi:hypothetical protein
MWSCRRVPLPPTESPGQPLCRKFTPTLYIAATIAMPSQALAHAMLSLYSGEGDGRREVKPAHQQACGVLAGGRCVCSVT